MSITVPRAGVIAGRAAQVRVEPDQTGAVISEFGQAMQQQAAKWQAEKLDMAGKRAQIGIARDLGLVRQEAEQLGDPEAIGTFWDTRYGEIREKWLNGTDENGQPLVAPELRDGLGLTLDELNNRHGLALGEKAIGLRQSAREAEWIEMRQQVTLDAATADPQSRAALLEIGEAAIDSRAAAGIISPAEAAREKIALRNDETSARATALIAADPAAFLDQAEAGEFNALGAETLATRRVQAQSALDRINAEAAKAAELAEKQVDTEIGKRLGVMTDLMSQGFTVTDEGFLTDARVKAHPDFPAAQAAQSLRDEMPGIRQATPAQLEAAIAAERAAPKTHKYQAERVKVLEGWFSQAQTRWNSDAVEQARRVNMPVPDLPDLDPADPEPFAAGLAARLVLDQGLRGTGHTKTQALLDDAERDALKAVIAPAADPEAKLALAEAVLAASGGKPSRALEVLEADQEFTRAVELTARGGKSAAAAILRGQQKLALKVTSLPPLGQRQLLFDELTQGAYADDPVLASKILSAASAIYADRAEGVDPDRAASKVPFMSDTEAVDIFRGAVEMAAGLQSDGAGRNPVGGFAVVKGQGLVIPPGISGRQVELAEEAVGYRLQGLVRIPEANATGFRGAAGGGGWYTRDSLKGVSGAEMPAQPTGLDILTAASVDGRMPALGDEATAGRRWDNMRFVRAPGQPEGGDTYELRWVDQYGEEHPVRATGGSAYRFSLSRLIREAAK